MKVYTTKWCADCHRAKYFLAQHGFTFEEIDIEETEGAASFVAAANAGKRRVPTFEINGRTFHCSPYNPSKLAQELGVKSNGAK